MMARLMCTDDVPQRIREVRMSARLPLGPLPGERRIAQMPGRDLRPHGGAPAHVEMKQLQRHRITHRPSVLRKQIVGYARAAPAPALERQKRHLLRWIEAAQIPVELEAVDHTGGRPAGAEEDVLRTQIPVPVQEARTSAGQQLLVPSQKEELRADELLHQDAIERKIAREQLVLVVQNLAA